MFRPKFPEKPTTSRPEKGPLRIPSGSRFRGVVKSSADATGALAVSQHTRENVCNFRDPSPKISSLARFPSFEHSNLPGAAERRRVAENLQGIHRGLEISVLETRFCTWYLSWSETESAGS